MFGPVTATEIIDEGFGDGVRVLGRLGSESAGTVSVRADPVDRAPFVHLTD